MPMQEDGNEDFIIAHGLSDRLDYQIYIQYFQPFLPYSFALMQKNQKIKKQQNSHRTYQEPARCHDSPPRQQEKRLW
jgi:hypothetical protein